MSTPNPDPFIADLDEVIECYSEMLTVPGILETNRANAQGRIAAYEWAKARYRLRQNQGA